MTDADLADLLARHPTLFHMAEAGAWPAIRAHGLLSTSALLDLYGVGGEAREALESRRRPEGVPLEAPGLPGAVVRDQRPMSDAGLARCLTDGLAPADWYRTLNARAFLWLTRARLLRLLDARPYRGLAHDVIEVDAASLIAAHAPRVALSPINSGTTARFARPRGRATFLGLADYPYAARRARGLEGAVELTVLGGVPDIAAHARRVVRMRGADEEAIVWQRTVAPTSTFVPRAKVAGRTGTGSGHRR